MAFDLDRLNSATKYPSIETYHQLDPQTGGLLEAQMLFDGDPVILTEKVDGTNARIIVMPDGDFFIGSREELLYASGDRVWSTFSHIVDSLLDLAHAGLYPAGTGVVKTFYLEVYGGNIGQGAKNYTTSKTATDYRLFDISFVPLSVLDMTRDQVALWRDHGGQKWANEAVLNLAERVENIELTPRLATLEGSDLPRTIDDTYAFLKKYLPATNVAIDPTARGNGEGIVLRTPDRVTIAKAKLQNYARTIRLREEALKKASKLPGGAFGTASQEIPNP